MPITPASASHCAAGHLQASNLMCKSDQRSLAIVPSVAVSAVTIAALVCTGAAPACQICIPFPKKSAAEILIESDAVALCRGDPENPFSLVAVETLKGDIMPGDAIDLFVDSTTRRVLATDPDRAVIATRRPDGGERKWRRIGLADAAFSNVVRKVLASAPAWRSDPPSRTEFFSKFLGHADSQVRALAHLEVAKAPYDQIARLHDTIPREDIRVFLKNFRLIEWHALYILLLAQSDDPRDRTFLRDALSSAEKFGLTQQLGAYTTAVIELDEAVAVARVEENYFRDKNRKPAELKAVIQALSVHGTNGHTHLRDRISAAYQTLLINHPEMAPEILPDIRAWKRGELTDTIARVVARNPRGLDLATVLKLRAHVREATASPSDPPSPGNNPGGHRRQGDASDGGDGGL